MHRRVSFLQLPLFLQSFPSHYSSCPTFIRSLQELPKCFSLTITQSVWAKPGFWLQAEENKLRSCLSLCRFGWTNTAIARRPKDPVLLLKKLWLNAVASWQAEGHLDALKAIPKEGFGGWIAQDMLHYQHSCQVHSDDQQRRCIQQKQ